MLGEQEVAQPAKKLPASQGNALLAEAGDKVGLWAVHPLQVTQDLVKKSVWLMREVQRSIRDAQAVLICLPQQVRCHRGGQHDQCDVEEDRKSTRLNSSH